jgi:hypothetical protein
MFKNRVVHLAGSVIAEVQRYGFATPFRRIS